MTDAPDRTLDAAVLERLSLVCERAGLGAVALASMARLTALLAFDPLAPTTIRAPDAVVERHIADSLCALDVPELAQATAIADIGSGAGLPGLPLATALPASRVYLVESSRRKRDFLERARRCAGATNAEIVGARVEEWNDGLGRMDAVTARALAASEVVLEYAAPLLRQGGVLLDWRSVGVSRSAASVAALVGMRALESRRVDPFAGARDLHINLYLKVRDTPSRFPRRAGMASKRPLKG